VTVLIIVNPSRSRTSRKGEKPKASTIAVTRITAVDRLREGLADARAGDGGLCARPRHWRTPRYAPSR
jgi:hypothetical protein